MKRLFLPAILLVGLASPAIAAPVTIEGAEQFPIEGDYQAGAEDGAGVLLLHQCNRDRQMYAPVAKQMQKLGLHTLAIDFRSFGGSQAGDYTSEKLAAIKPQEKQIAFWRKMARDLWGKDVAAAYDYLRARVKSDKPIGVIGVSCGGAQAIRLAGERDVSTLSLFSSTTSGRMMEVYKGLPATPTLFITSEEELDNIQPYFDLATHSSNRLMEYKGEGHGEPLMERDPSLAGAIANWFAVHLK